MTSGLYYKAFVGQKIAQAGQKINCCPAECSTRKGCYYKKRNNSNRTYIVNNIDKLDSGGYNSK